MRRWWKYGRWRWLVRPWWLVFSAVMYLSVTAFRIGVPMWYGIPSISSLGDVAQSQIALMSLTFPAVFYGFWRSSFFPAQRPGYGQWLAGTCWTADKPLPLGPAHLVLEDFVLLLILSVVIVIDRLVMQVVPWQFTSIIIAIAETLPLVLNAFLLPFLLLSALVFAQRPWTLAVVLAILPFSFYPIASRYTLLLVLLACYGVYFWTMRRALADFPWCQPQWTMTVPQQWLSTMRDAIGWPYNAVGPYRPSIRVSTPMALVIALLATWWLHAFIARQSVEGNSWRIVAQAMVFQRRDVPHQSGLWFVLLAATAFFRLVRYRLIYGSPISLAGRLCTRQWIIPGFDRVYVAPLAVLLVGSLGPMLLHRLGLPDPAVVEASVFTVLFFAFALGPTVEQWQLTGQHAIGKFNPARQQPASESTQRKPATEIKIF